MGVAVGACYFPVVDVGDGPVVVPDPCGDGFGALPVVVGCPSLAA